MPPSSARCTDEPGRWPAHLLAAREGRLDRHAELGPPSTVVTSLPLAWSVELAIRASAAGCPDGGSLLRTLAAWLPAPTRREVEWLAAHGDATCQAAAAELLEDLRDLTEEPLSIDVLGPLRLRIGEAEMSSPELRRSRVRTLLALLVLRGPLRRERICDLLWPDLEPEAAAQNLRVTLSRLRRLLEPDRARRPVDLEDSERHATRSSWPARHSSTPTSRSSTGTSPRPITRSRSAIPARRSRVSPARSTCGAAIRSSISPRSMSSTARSSTSTAPSSTRCLRLGELLLVAGRFDESLRCAERSRAGVAILRASAPTRDRLPSPAPRPLRAGVGRAVDSTLLADLGVEPDDATKMLLRRAAVRLGTSNNASEAGPGA